MTADDRAAHVYALKNTAVIAAVAFCVGVLAVTILQAVFA